MTFTDVRSDARRSLDWYLPENASPVYARPIIRPEISNGYARIPLDQITLIEVAHLSWETAAE